MSPGDPRQAPRLLLFPWPRGLRGLLNSGRHPASCALTPGQPELYSFSPGTGPRALRMVSTRSTTLDYTHLYPQPSNTKLRFHIHV